MERGRWEAKGSVSDNGYVQGFRLTRIESGGYLLERLTTRHSGDASFYGIFSFPEKLIMELYKALRKEFGNDNSTC